MNLPISSNAKNLASNLLGSHGGGLANKAKLPFGGLFGDKEKEKEKAKSESGKIAPQYATAKDAEIQLLNYEPLLLAKDDIDLLSTDWEDGATGTDITHIQNYVRGELMRREKIMECIIQPKEQVQMIVELMLQQNLVIWTWESEVKVF